MTTEWTQSLIASDGSLGVADQPLALLGVRWLWVYGTVAWDFLRPDNGARKRHTDPAKNGSTGAPQ